MFEIIEKFFKIDTNKTHHSFKNLLFNFVIFEKNINIVTIKLKQMIRFFHYLQYLVFPFFILTVYFILKGTLYEYSLEDVSLGVLCMGITFAFGSMGDITDISKKERRIFSNRKKFYVVNLFACSSLTNELIKIR